MPSCGKDEAPSVPEQPSMPSNPNEPQQPETPDAPDTPEEPEDPTPDQPELVNFAKGADVSWVTQMEDAGYKFKHINGEEGDLYEILKYDCGVNATRFRVWVDPTQYFDGGKENWNVQNDYNSIRDVVEKAQRAAALEMDIMIDFHFSDQWADPGNQQIPSSWMPADGSEPTLEHLELKMKEFIDSTLTALSQIDVIPNWVQIGNETRDGFLFPVGNATSHPDNFARLITTGYEAVKSFSEDIIVIVHEDNAWSLGDAKWLFGDVLEKFDAKYDMIGLSLYPTQAAYWNGGTWQTYLTKGIENAEVLCKQFNKPVMFVEVGMPWDEPENGAFMLESIMDAAKENDMLKGVFWWEPESTPATSDGYTLGAFNQDGKPNGSLAPFLDN